MNRSSGSALKNEGIPTPIPRIIDCIAVNVTFVASWDINNLLLQQNSVLPWHIGGRYEKSSMTQNRKQSRSHCGKRNWPWIETLCQSFKLIAFVSTEEMWTQLLVGKEDKRINEEKENKLRQKEYPWWPEWFCLFNAEINKMCQCHTN